MNEGNEEDVNVPRDELEKKKRIVGLEKSKRWRREGFLDTHYSLLTLIKGR